MDRSRFDILSSLLSSKNKIVAFNLKNLMMAVALAVGAMLGSHTQAGTVTMEADAVDLPETLPGSTDFVHVDFKANFDSVPCVFTTATTEGEDPAAVRVRNTTTTGFDIVQVEPSTRDPNDSTNGPHEAMTDVAWFAVEEGVHILEGGLIIEAHRIFTDTFVQSGTVFGDPGGFLHVPLEAPYTSSPVVLTHVGSMNNEVNAVSGEASSPWLTTTVERGSISPTGLNVAFERSEVDDNGGDDIDDGDCVILGTASSGSGKVKEGPVWEGLNVDNIAGWDDNGNDGSNGTDVFFSQPFSSTPLVIASIMRPDGEDGGWLRRGDVTPTSVRLTVDEDQFYDEERGHTTASASILAFSESFALTLTTVPEPSSLVLVASAALGLLVGRRRWR